MPKAGGQQINKKEKESKELDQRVDKGRNQKLRSDGGLSFWCTPEEQGAEGRTAHLNALTSPQKTFQQNSSVVFKLGI